MPAISVNYELHHFQGHDPRFGALMLEQNDEWAVTRRYMSLETVAQVCDDHSIDVARIAAL
jgi:hypothetical protein